MKLEKRHFGTLDSGEEVELFLFTNKNGYTCAFTNFGAYLVSCLAPDKKGKTTEVTLGYEDFEGYRNGSAFLGATVGRFANRISGSSFTIDGKVYHVTKTKGDNHLHGGREGFNKKLWKAETEGSNERLRCIFSRTSPDGEEGYPGNLEVKVIFELNEDNELSIEYRAETDKPTPVNLTNHAYWNLEGEGSPTVLNHLLTLNSSSFLPTDNEQIPTGDIADVSVPIPGDEEGRSGKADSVMDFRSAKAIGKDFDRAPGVYGGYDHCFLIDGWKKGLEKPLPAAVLADPVSGRQMTVSTTMPGIQLYTGNHLGSVKGRAPEPYPAHSAVCLETQHLPDAVNNDTFPDCILRPGQVYRHITVHRFSVAS